VLQQKYSTSGMAAMSLNLADIGQAPIERRMERAPERQVRRLPELMVYDTLCRAVVAVVLLMRKGK
jgi:hypothetical protein